MTPLSDRQNDESEQARAPFDAALLQLSRLRLGAERQSEDVFREAGTLITERLRVARVGIWVLLNEASAIRCEYLFQRGLLEACEGTILHRVDFPGYFEAIFASRSVAVADLAGDGLANELRDAYLTPLGITSMLDVPIYRGGRVVGIICHEHIGPTREWTRLEREFVAAIGDIAGRLWEEDSRRRARRMLGRYESRFAEVQRTTSMGLLAAGVAHDFSNVLTAVLGYADLIRGAARDKSDVVAYADALAATAEGANGLVRALLAYGRGGSQRPRVTALADILARSTGVLQTALGKGLELDTQVRANVGRVFVDPSQVERILLNLVMNARDGCPGGGRVTITLGEAPPPRHEASHGSSYVLLEVKDTGVGIEPAVLSRVFEPFFTTKGNKGTGLGLAIVNQAVTSAGGFVDIDSAPGKGTAVRIFLPRIASPE
jgi:two-component system, cell cycle sensor histidine kinase and response regulator CckA